KAARAVRRSGNVPCVLYGRQTEPITFQLPENAVKRLIYTTETHVLTLKLDGKEWSCIMKYADLHPVTDRPMHADFQVLEAGQMARGNTQVGLHELEVRCLPQDVPSAIDVDISELAIGDAIHIADITVPGAELLGRPEQTLVTVVPPRVEVEEEEAPELELAEGEEPVVPEEGEEAEEEPGESEE